MTTGSLLDIAVTSAVRPLVAGTTAPIVRWFGDIGGGDIATVGGKGANLGELVRAGLPVPPGFVVATSAYEAFVASSGLRERIDRALASLDVDDAEALQRTSALLRDLVRNGTIPSDCTDAILTAYHAMRARGSAGDALVAARSSATAEDTAQYSFAGMFESYLNVHGDEALLRAVRDCWASSFGARILFYRAKQGLPGAMSVAVIVQEMVASEKSGVLFTVDPASHDAQRLVIEAAWGLGEVVVGGQVTPDRYVLDKTTLEVVEQTLGDKAFMLVRDPSTRDTIRVELADDPRRRGRVLSAAEVRQLGELGVRVEEHYGTPQDIEFAVSGADIFLTQSRPITTLKEGKRDDGRGTRVLVRGLGASPGIASGRVRVLASSGEGGALRAGEILVAPMTSPDWVPVMRRAAGLVTDAGGMTSHAAIVSRELGIPCVVGTGTGTTKLANETLVTVDGARGLVLAGAVDAAVAGPRAPAAAAPVSAARAEERLMTGTRILVNLAEPERAEEVAARDVDGVGLLRAEFMLLSAFDNTHPRVLLNEKREAEFVERMVRSLRVIAKAFAPRPVIYRATDFKSNEFRNLKGGDAIEPREENPMLGYRGCYRYTKEPDLFALEMRALAAVRRELPNLHLMIPFVRTLSEVKECLALVAASDLAADHDLELWLMAEVPSVVYWLDEYAKLGITGVSIGSNDLTQLILGVDRDSAILAPLFDERDPAVLDAIHAIIAKCRRLGIKSSICGQAPSVHAEYAEQLVRWGIDSISVNPDVIERTRRSVALAERRMLLEAAREHDRE